MASFVSSGFALVGVLAGLIVPRLHKNTRTLRAQDAVLETVREQVQNSHGTNLREDVDKVLAGIGRLDERLTVVALDVNWLRREQFDQARRLTLIEEHE